MRHMSRLMSKKLGNNKRIAIYGAGMIGTAYYEQISNSSKYELVGWFDKNYKQLASEGKEVLDPATVLNYEFDVILIAIENKHIALEVGKYLNSLGLTNDKIIYHEAKGLKINSEFTDRVVRAIKNDTMIKLGIVQYPEVVNYSITNVCNCRCEMCNVWQSEHRENKQLSPNEIKNIFSNKLYKNTIAIGLSGGEPFTRKDLPEIVENIIEAVPSLKQLSIISNGTLKENVLLNLPEIVSICKTNNIKFSIMFSIDGLQETHNLIRGNKTAFQNLEDLLNNLDERNISYDLCTTIVKDNISELYEVLNYAKCRNKKIKFRVATGIERLYNSNLENNFNFTRKEKIKIAKFLEGLINNYEKDTNQKILYTSIISQLIDGKPRSAGCTWKNKGVSLDPNGNLYYCFAKSPCIGNSCKNDAEKLYIRNKKIRKKIIKEECSSCIHDYTGEHSLKTVKNFYLSRFNRRLDDTQGFEFVYHIGNLLTPILKKRKNTEKIKIDTAYITGWYGTETLGDKAIIGGIIKDLLKINPDVKINISSIVPYYTEETMSMLKSNGNYEIFGKKLKVNLKKIKESDIIIMGGGPLMDIVNVKDVLLTFMFAKLFKKKTIVWDCGLGPINNKKINKIVRNILLLSDVVMLRDENSANTYPEIVEGIDYFIGVDPAVNYLLDYYNIENKKNDYILFCIREWPRNYCHNEDEYESVNANFVSTIVQLVDRISLGTDKKILFYPMHTYFIGEDDRDFFYKINKELSNKNNIEFLNDEYSVDESIEIFKNAEMLVGMRFHSVVFGNTLGIPTLAIDYDTKRGKVFGFSELISNEENCINITNIDVESLYFKFNEINTSENSINKINNIHEVLVDKVSLNFNNIQEHLK